jgi:hypothetical protein
VTYCATSSIFPDRAMRARILKTGPGDRKVNPRLWFCQYHYYL